MSDFEDIWRKDLGCMGWLFQIKATETWMDFRAYQIVSTQLDGSNPEFHHKDSDMGHDTTPNPSEADVIEGYIKWDGCCEMDRDGRPHFCGLKAVQEEYDMIRALYEIASKKMAHFDKDCAGMS